MSSGYLTHGAAYLLIIMNPTTTIYATDYRSTEQTSDCIYQARRVKWLNTIAQSGCHGVGIDWTKSIKDAALELQGRVAIQGNLDPHTLLAPSQVIEAEVKKIMDTMQDYPGFIFNLGHGFYLLFRLNMSSI